ncbi:MAG: hypothetical protein ABIS07_17370 [Dokdonella sp.]
MPEFLGNDRSNFEDMSMHTSNKAIAVGDRNSVNEVHTSGGGVVLLAGTVVAQGRRRLKVGESEKVCATYGGRHIVVHGGKYEISHEEYRAFTAAAEKAKKPSVQAFIDDVVKNCDERGAKQRLRRLIDLHLPAGFRA